MTDLPGADWTTSSYSQPQGTNCVQIAGNLPGMVAVRDSKHPERGAHVVHPATWRTFITAIRTDRL